MTKEKYQKCDAAAIDSCYIRENKQEDADFRYNFFGDWKCNQLMKLLLDEEDPYSRPMDECSNLNY